jgi:hypothetical protein
MRESHMDERFVKDAIEKAIESLFAHQPDIFRLTPASAQTEWNLTHHLAHELSALFPALAYDVDIIKPDAGDRRPDIVYHRRGTHEDNFLVIEVKRDNQRAITGEIEKIEQYWFAEPYLYQFGAALNLNSDFTYQVEIRANARNPKNT